MWREFKENEIRNRWNADHEDRTIEKIKWTIEYIDNEIGWDTSAECYSEIEKIRNIEKQSKKWSNG